MPDARPAALPGAPPSHRHIGGAALRVVAVFFLFSLAWLVGSDLLLFGLAEEAEAALPVSLIKGAFYMAVASAALYLLIRRETRRWLRTEEQLQASRIRLDLAIDSIAGGEWDWDVPAGRMFISPRLKRLIGLEDIPDSIEAWQARIHPEDLPAVRESARRVLAGETDAHAAEYRIRHADGSWRWIATRGRARRNAKGEVTRLTGLDSDVTERKAAEGALADQEQQFRAIFEQSGVGLVLFTPDGHTVRANATLARFLGYEPEEMVGRTFLEFTYPGDVAISSEFFGAALTGKDGYALEKRYVCKDGGVVWGRVSATLLRDDRGKPKHFVAVVEDIDARKRFEESLLRANRSLSLRSRCNEILVRGADEAELAAGVSRMLVDLGGYRSAWIGLDAGSGLKRAGMAGFDPRRPGSRPYDTDLLPQEREPALSAMRSGEPLIVRRPEEDPGKRSLAANGGATAVAFLPIAGEPGPAGVIALASADPEGFAEEELSLLCDLSRDLSFGLAALRDRKRRDAAERAVEEGARQLRQLLQSTAEAIFGVDAEGRITFCNRTALQLVGRADSAGLHGASLHQTLHARFWGREPREADCPLCSAIREGRPFSGDDLQLRAEGREFYLEYFSQPIRHEGRLEGAVVAMVDITQRRAAEEQVRHTQKLDAVGQLTGGVAHDFNNLLAIIVGNLELLEERLADDPERSALTRQAIRAADRGADLTRQLLAFSRKQPLMPQPVDLHERLQEVVGMLRRTLGGKIDIELVRSPSLWKCEIDAAQFDNLLLNLALNARDSMPDGGKLTVETANVRLDADYAAVNADLEPGQYVMLAVSDSGTGMPPEVAERAFEPFFTTKKVGQGSGLGLSMVYGFVRQSGGHVKLYSEVGQGTTVRVYLPRARRPAVAAAPAATRPPQPIAGTRILVVEDDAEVCASTVALLEDAGCIAAAVPDAEAALARLENGSDYELLFTDVVLPGAMNGSDLARTVRARRPDMRVLFTSGYTQNAIVHHGRLDDGVEFIAKPYRKSELLSRIEKLVGEKAAE